MPPHFILGKYAEELKINANILVQTFYNSIIHQAYIIGEEFMDDILVEDSTQSQLTFGSTSPRVDTWDNGTVLVHTYSHMDYDLDPLDFNNHLSAK